MPFVTTAKNTMLDALTVDLVSLHSDHPGTDGLSNELTGGSPAYARKSITMAAASNGNRDSSDQPVFDIPPASDVAFVGFWNATGPVFMGYAPNGAAANTPQAAYAEATGDTINLDSHGLSDDDRVIFWSLADALPSPIAETTMYYVISSTASTFQISTTSGGAAVDIAADGDLIFQKVVIESFASQGQFTLQDADLTL